MHAIYMSLLWHWYDTCHMLHDISNQDAQSAWDMAGPWTTRTSTRPARPVELLLLVCLALFFVWCQQVWCSRLLLLLLLLLLLNKHHSDDDDDASKHNDISNGRHLTDADLRWQFRTAVAKGAAVFAVEADITPHRPSPKEAQVNATGLQRMHSPNFEKIRLQANAFS